MLVKKPSELQRREIFLALVRSQDLKMPVSESRKTIAERFGITQTLVSEIEREGVENDWPPLDE